MAFFILTRFVLVKYSRAFVERPSQGTSSLASRLTTVSLDYSTIVIKVKGNCTLKFKLLIINKKGRAYRSLKILSLEKFIVILKLSAKINLQIHKKC